MYFEHVKSLRFDDRPDYDYLKRLFRELFFRKGFNYDNLFDWELLAASSTASTTNTGVLPDGGGDEEESSDRQGREHDDNAPIDFNNNNNNPQQQYPNNNVFQPVYQTRSVTAKNTTSLQKR